MNGRYRFIGWLCVAIVLAGCGRSAIRPAPLPTATPVVTASPLAPLTPTFTPEPTATSTAQPPTSTPTVLPTATAEPTLTPTTLPAAFQTDPQIGQHPYSLTLQLVSASGVTQSFTIGFLLYLPPEYGQGQAQTWPLILFLHGSAENGTDPEQVAANGLPQLLAGDVHFPFMVLSPQAPDGVVWWGTELDQVHALLDQIQANYAVDPKRVYLTGISMGGFGAWAMAIQYPQRFAALVPIAGGWNSENDSIPGNICVLKDLPIWVFHGEQDDIVLPQKSQLMVDALAKCGSDVKFTLYPGADHRASWALAYAEPALFKWLLAQHLP